MKRKITAGFVSLAMAMTLVVGPAALVGFMGGAAGATTRADSFTNIPLKGDVGSGNKTFKGHADIKRFVKRNGHIKAVTRINGVIKHGDGSTFRTVTDKKRLLTVSKIGTGDGVTKLSSSASASAATCPILHLTLGPLDLNLLGLVVHLDKVVLTIDAQSGPGNLLGNLLCAIAHLLDQSPLSGQNLAAIKDILNAILGILNRL